MSRTIKGLFLVAHAVSASSFQRQLLQSTSSETSCDPYCADHLSGYCAVSSLYDANMLLETSNTWDESLISTKVTYAKCSSPVTGDPIMCPPIIQNTPVSCETCGYSWTNPDSNIDLGAPFSSTQDCCPGVYNDNGFHFNYNYAWNIDRALRWAYPETKDSCWGWWGCDTGYNCRSRNWYGKGTCKMSSDTRFHGESCTSSDQCNQVTSKHVDMVCSPVSGKCLLSEEVQQEVTVSESDRKECSCSVFDHGTISGFFTGLLFCKNNADCGGNMCSRTTQDLKMYCSATSAHSSQCSNCRTSDEACQA